MVSEGLNAKEKSYKCLCEQELIAWEMFWQLQVLLVKNQVGHL